MGRIVKSRYIKPNQVERATVFLSPSTCVDNDDESAICKFEPESETRVYEIKIETEDVSGNKAERICNVIVISDCHYPSSTSSTSSSIGSTSKSSKSSCKPHDPNDLRDWLNSTTHEPRHIISDLKYDWDPKLKQIFKPPEPKPSCKSGKGDKGSTGSKGSKGSKECACPGNGKSCSNGSKSSKASCNDVVDWDDGGILEPVSFKTEAPTFQEGLILKVKTNGTDSAKIKPPAGKKSKASKASTVSNYVVDWENI